MGLRTAGAILRVRGRATVRPGERSYGEAKQSHAHGAPRSFEALTQAPPGARPPSPAPSSRRCGLGLGVFLALASLPVRTIRIGSSSLFEHMRMMACGCFSPASPWKRNDEVMKAKSARSAGDSCIARLVLSVGKDREKAEVDG